jgi:hypothetical protein
LSGIAFHLVFVFCLKQRELPVWFILKGEMHLWNIYRFGK